ncbi:inosine/guanosine kinase [Myxococcota bacterium]|nr:inosine/guanosine kinase [Myxococcota bacterium]MBU1409967.1 inosine/guanosine kinase [Myxococcota bacterium]MBU1511755.1 inosine/guanosine kinase [Myxococcota bacterium]
MRFPGKRKNKHYFPVTERDRITFMATPSEANPIYIVGIDQLLVDIEAHVDDSGLEELGLAKGQSMLLDDATVDKLYTHLKQEGHVAGEFSGGSIGNTLHNYSVLADDRSCLLGTITHHITVGDYAFHYIRSTSARVDLNHLHPCAGPMGRAFCFVTPDGERSFGISRGIMDELPPEAVPMTLIQDAAALVITAYLLRNEQAPIFEATLKAMRIAHAAGVPIVISLGTEALVREKREFFVDIIREYGTILAGNFEEACTLTGQEDPLLAAQDALDLADLVLLTHGQQGLYIGAHVDRTLARETKDMIFSKSIPEYNLFEYSRAMRRADCTDPLKIYSHINPYLGGPSVIRNTNGAGDAALAALLHDLTANLYHRSVSPTSPKHQASFLTYSSIHQICKYANRVSFEVLRRNSPRLMQALPEREDNLEEAYWEK